MKYMISWTERPHGSAAEYENAQKRILAVFGAFQFPPDFKIMAFVVRTGTWGGYILAETSDLKSVQRICSIFPAFQFEVSPVLDIQDAVAAEMDAISWRDGLKI